MEISGRARCVADRGDDNLIKQTTINEYPKILKNLSCKIITTKINDNVINYRLSDGKGKLLYLTFVDKKLIEEDKHKLKEIFV